MKKSALLSFLFISTFTIVSCSDDDVVLDTEKPQIIINEPTAGQTFDVGEEMHLNASVTDNVELASYKIDIHFGGDGHEHKALRDDDHVEWKYQTTGTLSGKSDEVHLHVDIPENAEEGPYHIGVFAIDKAGNENVSWVTVEIHNDEHDH